MRRAQPIVAIAAAAIALLGFAPSVMAGAPPIKSIEGDLIRANAESVKAQATVVQAQAQMVNALSQARKAAVETNKSVQEYRGLALDNDLKTTKTYYERRAERDKYLAAHPRSRPTREDLVRYARAAAPKRLAAIHQQKGVAPISLSFGSIQWPAVLQQPQFRLHCLQVEMAFAERSPCNCGVGSKLCREVEQLTREMHALLKAQIHDLSPAEYMLAKRFLESVAYETRFPPEPAAKHGSSKPARLAAYRTIRTP